MLFSKWIEVPEDRQEDDPYSEVIKVSKGTVRRVWVLIPIPSAWCVGVQIWYATWQMWPTSRTEWIPGGMVEMEFEENIKIDDVPLEFTVKAYNEDTENKHKIWVALSVLRPTITSQMRQFFELFEE